MYYDVQKIRQFEDGIEMIELNDTLHQGKASQMRSYYTMKWMEYLSELEIELKAILLDRALFVPDLNQYFNKRL